MNTLVSALLQEHDNVVLETSGATQLVREKGMKKCLTCWMKLRIGHMYKHQGVSPAKINQYLTSVRCIEVQRIQIQAFSESMQNYFTACSTGGGDRLRAVGGGRKSDLRGEKEAKVIARVNAQIVERRRVSRSSIRDEMSAEAGHDCSTWQVDRLLERHKIQLHSPSSATPLTAEQATAAIRFFHKASHNLRTFVPSLQAKNYVQVDEIAASPNGCMKRSKIKLAFVPGLEAVPSCALDDSKKIATVLCFLATVPIPPIVIFRGAGVLSKEEKEKWKCDVSFTSKGNTTSELYKTVVIPHMLRFCPDLKVIVHDAALAHLTKEVDTCIRELGLWSLRIPGRTTQFLQALDIFFFSVFRANHEKIVHSVLNKSSNENECTR